MLKKKSALSASRSVFASSLLYSAAETSPNTPGMTQSVARNPSANSLGEHSPLTKSSGRAQNVPFHSGHRTQQIDSNCPNGGGFAPDSV